MTIADRGLVTEGGGEDWMLVVSGEDGSDMYSSEGVEGP